MPAPPTCPERTASASASSSTRPPRAALTTITPGLVSASWSLPIRPDRLGGLRQVDGDHVGATEQLVEREQLDAELGGAGGRDVRVVGDEGDVERREPLRHQLPDLAEPDDADRLARQLDAGEAAALPLPLAQARVGGRDVPGRGQQQGDRVLGGAHDVGRGRVDDHHAARGGRGHVDVVEPDARAGDDLEPGGRRERLGVDLGGRADEQRIGVGEGREERWTVGAVDVADLDVVAEQRYRATARASRRAGRQDGLGCLQTRHRS